MNRIDLRDLELRHRALDLQIHKLERRGLHMTPEERVRASELKKHRLVTKDQIFALRRS
jgi:uncharacterized protein YdcH (DUF465 family)